LNSHSTRSPARGSIAAVLIHLQRPARPGRPCGPSRQSGNCTTAELAQPDFESEYRRGNLRFRIPLQLFGLGILDGIQDREILARHRATAAIRAQLGIAGTPNRSGNDGTIARFGRKAQNKSIAMAGAESIVISS
jgi:CxxC motif-containing protein (DUF1111 family)